MKVLLIPELLTRSHNTQRRTSIITLELARIFGRQLDFQISG